jgi:hypothetical protein
MEHKKIENIKELRAELARLRAEADLQEQKINYNFQKVKEDLNPQNIIKNLFINLLGRNTEGKNILLRAINFGFSLFLQRMAIRTEHKVEEKIFEAITSVIARLKNLFKKKKKEEQNGQP